MPDPNNIIIPEHKLAFQFICKAGNTSVKVALLNWLYPQYPERQEEPHNPSWFYYCTGKSIPDDYIAVGFCRDPMSRLQSCYRDKVMKRFLPSWTDRFGGKLYPEMPWTEFVAAVCEIPDAPWPKGDQHFRSQTYDLNLGRLDYLVRVEQLPEAWQNVQDAMVAEGVVLPDLPHKNPTEGSLIVTEEERDMVYERYKADYELLGYEKE